MGSPQTRENGVRRWYRIGVLTAALLVAICPVAAGAQAFSTGAVPTRPDYYNVMPVAAPSLPAGHRGVDLSRFMPPVGNQGTLGSCVGWAVAYAASSFAAGISRAPGWSVASPVGQFSPAFLYNEVKARTEGVCNRNGIQVSTALQFAFTVGAIPLNRFGYNANDCALRPSDSLISQAGAYRIKDFASLGPWGAIPLDRIIQQLDAGRPVILTIRVDDAFGAYSGGILSTHNVSAINYHAIVAVGYDRDEGTLKLQNSWGRERGESGFVRVSFAAAQQMIVEGYTILDASALEPAPVPVPSPTPAPSPSPTPAPVPSPIPPDSLKQRYFNWFDAVEAGDIVKAKLGLDQGLRPELEVARESGMTLAIDAGNVTMLRLLLRYRPMLNTYVRHIGNYLRMASAADRNAVEMVRTLIDAGIDPNILDPKGYSLLCSLSPDSEASPGDRQIYTILKKAGGRCIAPEVKFL